MRIMEMDIVASDGAKLHTTVYEADTPSESPRDVLLLHGWPNAGRVWAAFAEAMLLGNPRFRLIAPTFRGYGESDTTDTGFTCAQFADDVLAVATTFHLAKFALAGHSMGGKIAQIVAARRLHGTHGVSAGRARPRVAGDCNRRTKGRAKSDLWRWGRKPRH